TATAPRAGGGTPPTGCKASGENSKKGAGGNLFPATPFFCFHCARGAVSFRFLTLHAETIPFDKTVCRIPGAGVIPLPRGYRGREAPCSGKHRINVVFQKSHCFFMHILKNLHHSLQNAHTMVK
ncbi:MAG: hypothetical protein IJN44_04280, partial [Clostridia bacterium]|nr:hypothetical protein [Clostridia bacterium]